MFKLLKYLKNSILSVLIATLLLVVQAVSDLNLPTYTSKIINVGIQQSGISDSVPEVVRKGSLEYIAMFCTADSTSRIWESYAYTTKTPQISSAFRSVDYSSGVYVLKKLSQRERTELDIIFSRASLLSMAVDGSLNKYADIDFSQNLGLSLPEGTSFKDAFFSMREEQRSSVVAQINSKLSAMPSTTISQIGAYFVQSEYTSLGVDMGSLSKSRILSIGSIMLGFAMLSMAAAIMISYIASRIAASISSDLRARVFTNILTFSHKEFSSFSTASLITRTTNDISNVRDAAVLFFRIVLLAPILAIGGIIKVMRTDTSMLWIIGLAFVIILGTLLILYRTAIPRFMGMQKLIDKVNLVSREILTGLSVIRAFGARKHEEKRFDKANTLLYNNSLYIGHVLALLIPLITFIMSGLTVLIVWVGAHDVNAGLMQVGDVMAFIQYTMQIIMAFLMIAVIYIILPRATVSADRINEILDTRTSIQAPKVATTQDPHKKGLVEFKDVSFRYQDSTENVLSHISFIAEPGKTTAIIGSTGSGKSTLVNLIPRLFDATEGKVSVGGVDVKEQTLQELRKSIGFVPQKGVLFSGTIESNIKFAGKNISDEAMEKAAKIAQAEEFISTKRKGFASGIAESGSNVSGGQRQRLSIARAIAADPDIFIFDDSFSALDFKTDAALRKALKETLQDKTIIIVAQRINTIASADQIIVMEDGKMTGKGTHEELIRTCSVYKQIALSQLSPEDLGV